MDKGPLGWLWWAPSSESSREGHGEGDHRMRETLRSDTVDPGALVHLNMAFVGKVTIGMGHLEALAYKPSFPFPCRAIRLIYMAARAGSRGLGDVVLSPRNTPFPGVPASSTTPGPIWVLLRDRWGRLSPSHQWQVLSQRPKGGVHVHMCVHGLISHS